MKKAILIILLASSVKADIILSLSAKYGANGFNESGVSTSSSNSSGSNHKFTSTSNSVDTLNVSNRVQVVPGIQLQTIPNYAGQISYGVSFYSDTTAIVNFGIRL